MAEWSEECQEILLHKRKLGHFQSSSQRKKIDFLGSGSSTFCPVSVCILRNKRNFQPIVEDGSMVPNKVLSSPDTWPIQKIDPVVLMLFVLIK